MNYRMGSGLAVAALLLAVAPQAFAQATSAGTQVTNQATVSFKVNGVDQDAPDPGEVTFLVDRRVDLLVAAVDGTATSVAPGEDGKPVVFTVTNQTNDIIDIGLSALNAATGKVFWANTLPADDATDDLTDNIQTGTFTLYMDADADPGTPGVQGDGVLTTAAGPSQDTILTDLYLDEVPAGASRTIFVVAKMPSTATDGQVAVVELAAQARSAYSDWGHPSPANLGTGAKGAVLASQSADTDDATAVQNVLADSLKDETSNAAGDGYDSAYDAYQVAAAKITVSKQTAVYWDPLNESTNPKAIPGAAVLYCVSVINEGATGASDVVISDEIPGGTTFVTSDADLAYSNDDGATTSTPSLSVTTSGNIRFSESQVCDADAWDAAYANAGDTTHTGDPTYYGDGANNPWTEDSASEASDPDGRYGQFIPGTPAVLDTDGVTVLTPAVPSKVTTTVANLPAATPGTPVTPAVTTTMFLVEVN